jgi:plasmid stabilization system protein ParE
MSLETMPNRGWSGRIAGNREFVIAPFFLFYRIKGDAVEVLRVYHSAQD